MIQTVDSVPLAHERMQEDALSKKDEQIKILALTTIATLATLLIFPWELSIPISAVIIISAIAFTGSFDNHPVGYHHHPMVEIVEPPPVPVFIPTPIVHHRPPFYSFRSHGRAPVGTGEFCPPPRMMAPHTEPNRAPVGNNGMRTTPPLNFGSCAPAAAAPRAGVDYFNAARAPVGQRR